MYVPPSPLSSTVLSSAVEAKTEYYLSSNIKRKVRAAKLILSWGVRVSCDSARPALSRTTVLSRLPSNEESRTGEDFSVPRQVCKVSLKEPEHIFYSMAFQNVTFYDSRA